MEKYFFPGKNKKSYINKISRLFFFATWLTKFFILILHYPKTRTDGDLGAGLYFWLLILVYLIIITPLEITSFRFMDRICGKVLKIILIIFDLFIFSLPLIDRYRGFKRSSYFPFTLYIASFLLYFISCVGLIYFIIYAFKYGKNSNDKNEVNNMIEIDSDKK